MRDVQWACCQCAACGMNCIRGASRMNSMRDFCRVSCLRAARGMSYLCGAYRMRASREFVTSLLRALDKIIVTSIAKTTKIKRQQIYSLSPYNTSPSVYCRGS